MGNRWDPRKTDRRRARVVPAGVAKHVYEVAGSGLSYGSGETATLGVEEEDSGTCLTKHSCGRYLVHATTRTGERAHRGHTESDGCAQNTRHSSASRGTEIGEREEWR